MKVKIAIEFEVEALEDDDFEMTEDIAKSAASVAAYDYLAFVEVSGRSTDSEEVEVRVDGFGTFNVKVGQEHE